MICITVLIISNIISNIISISKLSNSLLLFLFTLISLYSSPLLLPFLPFYFFFFTFIYYLKRKLHFFIKILSFFFFFSFSFFFSLFFIHLFYLSYLFIYRCKENSNNLTTEVLSKSSMVSIFTH